MALVNENISVTKNLDTKAAYLDRANNLITRYKKKHPNQAYDHGEMIAWVISTKPSISRSTWRQYKASLVWYFEQNKMHALSEHLKDIGNSGCKEPAKSRSPQQKTSAKKKKSVTEREEQQISSYLQETAEESFWSKPVLAFFKATLATGLRPDEWQHSVLLTEPFEEYTNEQLPVLKIRNAKATNGRSHGEFRHVELSSTSDADLLYIRIALQYANPRSKVGWMTPEGKAESWFEYYKKLRAHLYRVTTKLYPVATRRVTMYSCRHQLIADLKKAKYKLAEIAAIVGHGTDETASVHYGRAKHGRNRGGLPKPRESEVLRIKQVYQGRPAPNASPSIKQ